MMRIIGALEGGGTKMVLGIFTEQGEELKRQSLPTLSPEETVPQMISFFAEHPIDALGIASFGPVDLHKNAKTYGTITTAPKIQWQNFNLLNALAGPLGVPCEFDTDVNAAALAEAKLGAAKGMTDAVYITIGTGIGGGILSGGNLVHGMLHPEMGHMLLRPHPEDPNPKGVCLYHVGCLEGLAAGPAIGARVQGDARELPDDHPTFAIEAYYLAQMCVNMILTVSPQRIILGGGVMERKALFPMIRKETQKLLNGYVQAPAVLDRIDEYIVPPALFPVSGLVGAYLLGKRALTGQ